MQYAAQFSLLFVVATTLTLLALNLSGPPGAEGTLNGYGYTDIYVWHPVFMSLAFVFCFPLAQLAYVLPSSYFIPEGKRNRRVLHAACNLFGTVLVLLGFSVAYVYHAALNKPHAGLNEPAWHQTWTRPAHVIIGYMVVIAILLQCCAGLTKYVLKEREDESSVLSKALKYHGRLGPIVWVLGLFCICLALYFEYLEVPPHDAAHWTLGQIAVAGVLIIALAVSLILALHSRRSVEQKLDDERGEDETYRAGLINAE
jgi:hypothetical protein